MTADRCPKTRGAHVPHASGGWCAVCGLLFRSAPAGTGAVTVGAGGEPVGRRGRTVAAEAVARSIACGVETVDGLVFVTGYSANTVRDVLPQLIAKQLAYPNGPGRWTTLNGTATRAARERSLRRVADVFEAKPTRRPEATTGRSKTSRRAARIAARDGDGCFWCGVEFAAVSHTHTSRTIDHVVPLAHRGSNTLANLVLACRRCNSSKGDMPPAAWIAALRERLPSPAMNSPVVVQVVLRVGGDYDLLNQGAALTAIPDAPPMVRVAWRASDGKRHGRFFTADECGGALPADGDDVELSEHADGSASLRVLPPSSTT